MKSVLLGLIPLLMCWVQISFAQSVSLPNTEERNLISEKNGVNYRLLISLPKDYASSNEKYSVVYLLDAGYSFAIAHNIVEHLSDRKDLPKLILIGIAYDPSSDYKLNRTRDYTPTFVGTGGYGEEYQKLSGGGPKFFEFLTQELIPYVNKSFRSNGNKTIVGHSFGGLYGSWLLSMHPEVFDRYILVSPSLWYDHKLLLSLRKTPRIDQNKVVYLSIGSLENTGDFKMVDHLRLFSRKLLSQSSKVRMDIFSGDNHNSVFPAALSKGLIFTQDRDNPELAKKFGLK